MRWEVVVALEKEGKGVREVKMIRGREGEGRCGLEVEDF